jgi:hypothetical protein
MANLTMPPSFDKLEEKNRLVIRKIKSKMRDYTENHDSLAIDTDTARKIQGLGRSRLPKAAVTP